MKLVTYTLSQIKKAVNGERLQKMRPDTLRTMINDCDEHTCFARSNEEAHKIGFYRGQLIDEENRRVKIAVEKLNNSKR